MEENRSASGHERFFFAPGAALRLQQFPTHCHRGELSPRKAASKIRPTGNFVSEPNTKFFDSPLP